ncbi:unnamed protein product [Sphagnum jensenii]|uniref:Uncharacterized protein n=1 Tax=Sphagnum jensenii TaxID=128206 RepID=A0ABP1AYA5_9BRYO
MNAVRFCTKEEEVLKVESFRRRWNAVSLCTKDEISKIELQNTVRFCTQEEEVLKIELQKKMECSCLLDRVAWTSSPSSVAIGFSEYTSLQVLEDCNLMPDNAPPPPPPPPLPCAPFLEAIFFKVGSSSLYLRIAGSSMQQMGGAAADEFFGRLSFSPLEQESPFHRDSHRQIPKTLNVTFGC